MENVFSSNKFLVECKYTADYTTIFHTFMTEEEFANIMANLENNEVIETDRCDLNSNNFRIERIPHDRTLFEQAKRNEGIMQIVDISKIFSDNPETDMTELMTVVEQATKRLRNKNMDNLVSEALPDMQTKKTTRRSNKTHETEKNY